MAENIKLGWLEDYDEVKFAPKTFSEQILNADGTSYEVSVQNKIDAINTQISNIQGGTVIAGAADKLDVADTGDATTPVYFKDGIPVECTGLDLNTSGFAAKTYFAASQTAANTAAKIAPITSGTFPTSLTEGLRVTVWFKYANNAAKPTLKVGNSTAKSIYPANITWEAQQTLDFVYDGAAWSVIEAHKAATATKAATANALATAGAIQIDLTSNNATIYTNGGNITPGITGILDAANGGTGNATGRVQIGQKEGEELGTNATSEGNDTIASGNYSHAEGDNTTASGNDSHAEGYTTIAQGYYSHAEGINAVAGGFGGHAEGNSSKTVGNYSHAEGENTRAIGNYSHSGGYQTTAYGEESFAHGYSTHIDSVDFTTATLDTIKSLRNSAARKCLIAYGKSSQAEGIDTIAYGEASHVEGNHTFAQGDASHSEGDNSYAEGIHSHAEGYYSFAQGAGAHAEGSGTAAIGNYSHAEGTGTTAIGVSAHSEGSNTTAHGEFSHAEGGSEVTFTALLNKYNREKNTNLSLDNITHGNIYNVWKFGQETTDYAALAFASGGHSEGYNNLAIGGHAEGDQTYANENAHAEGCGSEAKGFGSHAEGECTRAEGTYSHAEGKDTITYYSYAHAEGDSTRASGDNAHAEGFRSVAEGISSHAEGSAFARGIHSHAEGDSSFFPIYLTGSDGIYTYSVDSSPNLILEPGGIIIVDNFSYDIEAVNKESNEISIAFPPSEQWEHKKGLLTYFGALGYCSHVEGGSTKATGSYAHASGFATEATGQYSWAHGSYTIANGDNQMVIGKYNVADTTSAFIIGNGTSSNHSNAMSVSWTGEVTASKVYGAVWNDYAEYRTQKEIIEPGYCVASTDNGQVYKTTEKFQACDGIVSDTFGFAIGETNECKTPLAVAGRVLAYCEGNRYDYHAGDTVCAGPEGKVCKMTREEIREWPDRIIGIVSEIPEYETWGTGNIAVNGRIWIKVK